MRHIHHRRVLIPVLLAAASACARPQPAPKPIASLADLYGTVAATVVDAETGEPVVGAAVWASKNRGVNRDTVPVLTGVTPGRFTLHVDAPGYQPASLRVRVARGETARPLVPLRRAAPVPAPPGVMVVRGRVVNVSDGPMYGGVFLRELSSPDPLLTIGPDRTYRLEIAVDTLRGRSQLVLMAYALGLTPQRRTVPVRPGEEVTVDFRLRVSHGFGAARPRGAPARVAGARVRDAGSHARGADR